VTTIAFFAASAWLKWSALLRHALIGAGDDGFGRPLRVGAPGAPVGAGARVLRHARRPALK
jgi:hypothetical protein